LTGEPQPEDARKPGGAPVGTTMTRRPWRSLSTAPRLLTAYLEWRNSARRGRRRRLQRRSGLVAALALYFAGMAALWIHVRAAPATAIAQLAWLQRHTLFWAAMAALVAGILVSRRRALNHLAAGRSWIAALPVERSTARWQALALDSVPALVMACLAAAAFGGLCLLAIAGAGITAPIVPWAATTAGVALGAAFAHWRPAVRLEEAYEGSRYVPHRRRALTPVPTGSLAALGSWPVRQLFASARPKTVARAVVPILLAVPMGSTAADAMLALGLLTAIGALALLAVSALSVSAKASRWLTPLPLGSGPLVRSTLMPALASMGGIACIETWLLWVMGLSSERSLAIGVATLLAGLIITTAGSLLAIGAGDSHRP
jgi:hypothetical protein